MGKPLKQPVFGGFPMRAVYSRLLEKMRLDRWRVFDRRYSPGKFTKLWLVLRGWFGALG